MVRSGGRGCTVMVKQLLLAAASLVVTAEYSEAGGGPGASGAPFTLKGPTTGLHPVTPKYVTIEASERQDATMGDNRYAPEAEKKKCAPRGGGRGAAVARPSAAGATEAHFTRNGPTTGLH